MKRYKEVNLKVKRSPTESYTFNEEGHLLKSVLSDSYLFLCNQNTLEYRLLFPVDQLEYLDFELLEGGDFLFLVRDVNDLTCQLRDFNKGVLEIYPIKTDRYCFPSIVTARGREGIYYSRDHKVIRRAYSRGSLGPEEVLLEVPGEYLDYAFENRLVTKVINYEEIENISVAEGDTLSYTRVELQPTWEKKRV